jgi:hypothetical protein
VLELHDLSCVQADVIEVSAQSEISQRGSLLEGPDHDINGTNLVIETW